jgi:protein-S-isoprenylcysteine O-methyltransferase Ste14
MSAGEIVRGIVSQVILTAVFIGLLFGPAGTLNWPAGWAFLLLFAVCSQGMGLWLLRTDPALLQRRMASPLAQSQTPYDRAIITVILVVVALWVAFMGLDGGRLHLAPTPFWAKALGGALIVLAFLGWTWVLAANRFAAITVGVMPGQQVATRGPYAIVRHPMYALMPLLLIGGPLMTSSLWSLVFLIPAEALLAARTLGEEQLLMRDLAGYAEYAVKVRWRLVPGVW